MTLNDEISNLKLKKARMILEIESLAVVNDSVYTKLGKTVAEIIIKEKQQRTEVQNILDED